MKITDSQYDEIIALLDELADNNFESHGDNSAVATVLGIKTTQEIHHHSIYTDSGNQVSSFSESALISTALKCTDLGNDEIQVISGNSEKDLNTKEGERLSYSAFLSEYGIMPLRKYYIKELIAKTELKDALSDEDAGIVQYGFLSYDLQDYCITSYEKVDHKIHLVLRPEDAARHYRIQMKKTGSLTELPIFKKCELTLILNEEENQIVGFDTSDRYLAKVGLFRLDVEMEGHTEIRRI